MAKGPIPSGSLMFASSWLLLLLHRSLPIGRASTEVGFYDSSCSSLESVVKSTVQDHAESDVTIAAGLIRLHFHDCFVHGCDGSILVNSPSGERTAPASQGLRGFEVIEDAKSRIERICPGKVSCADILAIAARDAVSLSGGPSWNVPLGRRDGRASSAADAANMPSPLDSVPVLKQKFSAKGLSAEDLVILNGGHTLGQSDCRFFSYRLYNYSGTGKPDPSIDSQFLSTLQALCPRGGDGTQRVALDRGSETDFGVSFFRNVLKGCGVLESDQRLAMDSSTEGYVKKYASRITGLLGIRYHLKFADSMIKMSNIEVKTGSDGEIRNVCSSFN